MANLNLAAQADNVDRLYELIADNPKLLDQIDEIPFVNTPLHIAAEAGCTHFAIEILSLKPSFGRKLNSNGLSPLDLALRNGHGETVKRLIEIDSELIRVQGKERWTPLHYVAKVDNVDLLANFLIACPLSINDVTNRKENALHIAAANGKIGALEVLVGWLRRTDNHYMLSRKDEKGNTLLHVVAYNYQLYGNELLGIILVKLRRGIDCAERNSDGLKARDIISQSQLPHRLKEAAKRVLQSWRRDSSLDNFTKYLRSELRMSEIIVQIYYRTTRNLTTEMVNSILVVVTLIVTASYQAAVQPPTGLIGDHSINSSNITATFIDNHNSTIPFQNQNYKKTLNFFYLLHSLVFATCVSIIIVVLEFNFISVLVQWSLICLYINYVTLVYNQGVDAFVKGSTFITFLLSYIVLALKGVTKVISIYQLKFIADETKYLVKIQRLMISSKHHGQVGTTN